MLEPTIITKVLREYTRYANYINSLFDRFIDMVETAIENPGAYSSSHNELYTPIPNEEVCADCEVIYVPGNDKKEKRKSRTTKKARRLLEAENNIGMKTNMT